MLEDNQVNENTLNNTENRDASCCCMTRPAPEVFTTSYKFTNTNESKDLSCEEKNANRRQMINKIRSLDFSIVELAQYLDTHPNDRKAIALHKEYANALNELKDQYQRVYGPLTINFPCNKWRWIEEPWPWERGNF